jgi:hypothetical protein
MTEVQELFHGIAAQHGVRDSPEFQEAAHRVARAEDENLAGAARVVAGLEEDYELLLAQQERERDAALADG